MKESASVNQLQFANSPYLLQHKNNPVHWLEWKDTAFRKAVDEDKPVFLSIGYSTCHWCHVMEKESFEDHDVAELLNQNFISIKVDREERPDIDHLYMAVCQMLGQNCGWPLTVIMTPQAKPFFVATYIPRNDQYGRPGMMQLLPAVAERWKTNREDLISSANKVASYLQEESTAAKPVKKAYITAAVQELRNSFDNIHGGFGNKPKFPAPHNLLFLMQHNQTKKDKSLEEMVSLTLTKMRLGGIFDHIGFGFHRYSTDQRWFLPHFEKMLYDQGMLLTAYASAARIGNQPLFSKTAEEIVSYVERVFKSREGGFYCAEDADSEGEEGTYYLWRWRELDQLLSPAEKGRFVCSYNLVEEGNYFEEATGENTGANIPFMTMTHLKLAEQLHTSPEELLEKLEVIREKLFQYREKRTHPGKDDKILTDWNGLMIAALAFAGRLLDHRAWIDSAIEATAFVDRELTDHSGRLLHSYRSGIASVEAFLDDYAYQAWGSIELFLSTGMAEFLKRAIHLVSQVEEEFHDPQAGGYFYTSVQAEELLARKKEFYDGAIPSGNSVMVHVLALLFKITGDVAFREKLDRLISGFGDLVARMPGAFTHMLQGYHLATSSAADLVIVASTLDQARQAYLDAGANKVTGIVTILKTSENAELLEEINPFLSNLQMQNNQPTFFLCKDFMCESPTTDKLLIKQKLLEI